MTQRKLFNYISSTAESIAVHFNNSTSQAIYAVRKQHAANVEMTAKLNEAYRLYRIARLQAKMSTLI